MNQDVVRILYMWMLAADMRLKVKSDGVYFTCGPSNNWWKLGPHNDTIKPYILERR